MRQLQLMLTPIERNGGDSFLGCDNSAFKIQDGIPPVHDRRSRLTDPQAPYHCPRRSRQVDPGQPVMQDQFLDNVDLERCDHDLAPGHPDELHGG